MDNFQNQNPVVNTVQMDPNVGVPYGQPMPVPPKKDNKKTIKIICIILGIIMIIGSIPMGICAVDYYDRSESALSRYQSNKKNANDCYDLYDEYNDYGGIFSVYAQKFYELYEESMDLAQKEYSLYQKRLAQSIAFGAGTVILFVGGVLTIVLPLAIMGKKKKKAMPIMQPVMQMGGPVPIGAVPVQPVGEPIPVAVPEPPVSEEPIQVNEPVVIDPDDFVPNVEPKEEITE